MKYYYSLDHKPVGPVPLDDLHALYRDGVITLTTLIVEEGGTEWKAYSTLNPSSEEAPPIAAPAFPAPAASTVIAASPVPAPEPATPPFAASPAQPSAVSAPKPSSKNLVLISYILLGFTALVSVIPVLGCFSWVMLIPVLIATITLGILILKQGGQRDGIIILALSLVVLPVFTVIAPIVTTAIFGKVTGLGDKPKTTAPAGKTVPAATNSPLPAAPSLTEDVPDTRNKAITKSLDQFLTMLNGGQYDQSFDAASPTFRQGVTKAAWANNMKENRESLGQATDHQLKGLDTKTDLTTGAKTYVVPVASTFEKGKATEEITFVQDTDQQYRVADYSLTTEFGSTAPAASSKDVPNDAAAKQMVNNTMVNFKNAVNSGDFEAFYRTQLSDLWKKQTTPTKLAGNFQTFIDKKIDLSPIFLVQPVLDPAPSIGTNGMLVLKGRYAVTKQKVNVTFDLTYSREAKWGLSGINVQLKPTK